MPKIFPNIFLQVQARLLNFFCKVIWFHTHLSFPLFLLNNKVLCKLFG